MTLNIVLLVSYDTKYSVKNKIELEFYAKNNTTKKRSKNMIVIGYQGIGKSTLAGKNKFIDLESGNMWVNGKRAEDWYIPYCQMAVHLSQQGFTVFTSSHEVVRDQLKNYNEKVVVCYPSEELKSFWIEKLHERWIKSGLDKDYKALANAEARYSDNIKELVNEKEFYHLIITDMNYNLKQMIEKEI